MNVSLNPEKTTPSSLNGCRVLVVGLGESGLAMATWLHQQQAEIAFVDTRVSPPGVDALLTRVPSAEWRALGQSLTATDIAECLAGIELLALSPGVAIDHPLVVAAQQQGIAVWSEIDCFHVARQAACPQSRVVAITGANGKTTTTALTAHLLNAADVKAVACGNISPSALDAFMACAASGTWPAVWVLELSSFQLEATAVLETDTAIILNLSEDHLDRHYTLAGYAAAKARIYRHCAHPIWNRADLWAEAYGLNLSDTQSIGDEAPERAEDWGIADGFIRQGAHSVIALHEIPLLGRHNALNVMAALALARHVVPAAVCVQQLAAGVKTFAPLPHRMVLIATHDQVRYVDDSKATNVGATLAAIEGLYVPGAGKLSLVLGGDGKGQDFSPLGEPVARAARAVALIGKDAARIAQILPSGLPVAHFSDLPSATRWLADQSLPGDTVLLSPACASLDMFRSYADRAAVFMQAVQALSSCKNLEDGASL